MDSAISEVTISQAKALNAAVTVLSLVGVATTVICALLQGVL